MTLANISRKRSKTGRLRLSIATTLVVAVMAGCSTAPSETEPTATATGPQLEPTASIQDIMLSMVDPSADGIWESVATIITPEGTDERRPSTPEEWEALYHWAVTLVESSNLLRMEGRQVARPGFESENPGIELEPHEVQILIDNDPDKWNFLAHNLHVAASVLLEAIEKKDADMVFDNGGPLDQACEGCHRQYWYPDDDALELIHKKEAEEKAAAAGAAAAAELAPPPQGGGTIRGRTHLDGKSPGNVVVRMSLDPGCVELNRGKTVVQESIAATADGSLANVFVRLDGKFPATAVPDEPVEIDQKDCVFEPRVLGARAGQTVRLHNSDPLLHNVHSMSSTNAFNISQPTTGMDADVKLEAEDEMVRIKCDVHRWMTQYIGVVDHPYFATSDADGSFEISNVPAGTHTIRAWHEVFGVLTETVDVEDGEETTVDFSFKVEPV